MKENAFPKYFTFAPLISWRIKLDVCLLEIIAPLMYIQN